MRNYQSLNPRDLQQQLEHNNSLPTQLEGDLYKKGVFTKLKRYYVLKNNMLCYYISKRDYLKAPEKPKGSYLLSECQFHANVLKLEPLGLKIIKGDINKPNSSIKVSQILFDTFETSRLWVQAINHNKGLLERAAAINNKPEQPKRNLDPPVETKGLYQEKRSITQGVNLTARGDPTVQAKNQIYYQPSYLTARSLGPKTAKNNSQVPNLEVGLNNQQGLKTSLVDIRPKKRNEDIRERPYTSNGVSTQTTEPNNVQKVSQIPILGPSYEKKKNKSSTIVEKLEGSLKKSQDFQAKENNRDLSTAIFKKTRTRFLSMGESWNITHTLKRVEESQNNELVPNNKQSRDLRLRESVLEKTSRSNYPSARLEDNTQMMGYSSEVQGKPGETSRKSSRSKIQTQNFVAQRATFKKFQLRALLPQARIDRSSSKKPVESTRKGSEFIAVLRNLPRGSVNLNLSLQIRDKENLSTNQGSGESPLERQESYSPQITSNSFSPNRNTSYFPLNGKEKGFNRQSQGSKLQIIDLNATDNMIIPNEEEEGEVEDEKEVLGLKDINVSLLERSVVSHHSHSPLAFKNQRTSIKSAY